MQVNAEDLYYNKYLLLFLTEICNRAIPPGQQVHTQYILVSYTLTRIMKKKKTTNHFVKKKLFFPFFFIFFKLRVPTTTSMSISTYGYFNQVSVQISIYNYVPMCIDFDIIFSCLFTYLLQRRYHYTYRNIGHTFLFIGYTFLHRTYLFPYRQVYNTIILHEKSCERDCCSVLKHMQHILCHVGSINNDVPRCENYNSQLIYRV